MKQTKTQKKMQCKECGNKQKKREEVEAVINNGSQSKINFFFGKDYERKKGKKHKIYQNRKYHF